MKSNSSSFILPTKIISYYTNKELQQYFSRSLVLKMVNGQLPELYVISKKISISQIQYTIDEFIYDNPKYESYSEKNFLFDMLSNGISIKSFVTTHNISVRKFHAALKKGFSKCEDIDILIAVGHFSFSMEDLQKDLSLLKIILKDHYLKLIGLKPDLEYFQEKYKIDFDITDYQESYFCLAFDGYLFNVIMNLNS